MNDQLFILRCAGITVVLLLALIIGLSKKSQKERRFDERQLQVQGTAYKIGFITLIIYNGIYALLSVMLGNHFCDETTGLVIGILVSLVPFAGYCIWNDAYFSLNENPKLIFISWGFLATSNTLSGVTALLEGKAIEDGKLTFRSCGLFLGIACLLLFIVSLVKSIHNKKQA